MSKTYCGDCAHFLGMGDFDLCCDIKHPTPKEIEMGIKYDFGFICSALRTLALAMNMCLNLWRVKYAINS